MSRSVYEALSILAFHRAARQFCCEGYGLSACSPACILSGHTQRLNLAELTIVAMSSQIRKALAISHDSDRISFLHLAD